MSTRALYISLKDSITSEEYTKRLAVLEANLELAKKQAHIETLTQQQQLHQQELKQAGNFTKCFYCRAWLYAGVGSRDFSEY